MYLVLFYLHQRDTFSVIYYFSKLHSTKYQKGIQSWHWLKKTSIIIHHGFYLTLSVTPRVKPWVNKCCCTFWVCGWNPSVWPFKWKLLSSTFCIWQFCKIKFKIFFVSFELSTYLLQLKMFRFVTDIARTKTYSFSVVSWKPVSFQLSFLWKFTLVWLWEWI